MMIVERGICRSGKDLIVLEAGSAIEEVQNCHIGNLYGGLSHALERFFLLFLLQQRTLVVAFLRRFLYGLSTSNF